MYNFKYDIKVDEENGRPYIHLDQDYSLEPEHRFMAMELVTYSLNDLIIKYSNPKRKLSKRYLDELIVAGRMISSISDQLAVLIKEQDENFNQLKNILNNKNEDKDEENDDKDSI